MNDLLTALEITALGMGLVFAAIVLLWWMMALLTRFAADRSSSREYKPGDGASDSTEPVRIQEFKARAAAIAVATALAEQHMLQAQTLFTPPTAIVSAWQLGMRTRHLSEKGIPRIRKPRRVG